MKKTLAMLAALAMLSALLVPFSAIAENDTIQPEGGNPFSVNPNPGSRNTELTFSVDPAYTITIPRSVILQSVETEPRIYSNYSTLSASNVFLNEGQKIVITLSSATKFNMSAVGSMNYILPYTASTEAFGAVDKETGGKVAEFIGMNTPEPQTVYVNFRTDTALQYAGTYGDVATFTIQVMNSE